MSSVALVVITGTGNGLAHLKTPTGPGRFECVSSTVRVAVAGVAGGDVDPAGVKRQAQPSPGIKAGVTMYTWNVIKVTLARGPKRKGVKFVDRLASAFAKK